jgi:regulator of sigma E protease
MVQEVVAGSAAEAAGIDFGDKIFSINGMDIRDAASMSAFVQDHQDEALEILIARNGEMHTVALTPRALAEGEDAVVGVHLADAGVVRFPWYIAIYKGFVAAAFATVNIVIAFAILIKNLVLGQGLAFSVAGPVGIAVLVGDSARLGLSYLINVMAMLSLSLAVINILPIPALDGGRLLFVVIEKIFKRPVPLKYEQLAHTIGFVLLMVLIVVVTWRDVVGLF